MSKKTNTWLFILGATIFNMLVTIASFFLLLFIYANTIMNLLPDESKAFGLPIIFIAAIVAAFLIYRYALKFFLKKVEVEKYFDPIFGGKRKN